MAAGLGQRYPVQRRVQLSVPGSGESVPGLVRRPHRQRCSAVMACVGVLRAESRNAGGLSQDLRRRQGPAADDRQQCRSDHWDPAAEFGREFIDLLG